MNSITLKPEIQELYTLNEFISNELQEENLQVNLIVEEIFANIVNYSNTLKENPKTPKNIEEAEIGGLGIYLTKELADELEYQYENDENHLIIIKNVE